MNEYQALGLGNGKMGKNRLRDGDRNKTLLVRQGKFELLDRAI